MAAPPGTVPPIQEKSPAQWPKAILELNDSIFSDGDEIGVVTKAIAFKSELEKGIDTFVTKMEHYPVDPRTDCNKHFADSRKNCEVLNYLLDMESKGKGKRYQRLTYSEIAIREMPDFCNRCCKYRLERRIANRKPIRRLKKWLQRNQKKK